jgi:spore protease
MRDHFPWRTDLAVEAADTGDGALPDGVSCKESRSGGVLHTAVFIRSDGAAARLGRPVGVYHTLEGDLADGETLTARTAALLREMLPNGAVLVVGLGNRAVTPDALGPMTVDGVIATRHLPAAVELSQVVRPVACLSPGAAGQTGLETATLVRAALSAGEFSAVIAVDALAARSVTRLGRTIQLSDSGIAPGAGVANRREELSRRTLGVPVLSLGIPTVIDAATMLADLGAAGRLPADGMVVTPRDVDCVLRRGARILSTALNRALQDRLDDTDVQALMA